MAVDGKGGRPDLGALRIDDSKRSNNGPRRRRWPWVVLALAVVAVGAFLALGSRPVEVVVAAARSAGGRAAALLNASGYVTPRRRATVAAKITGRVEEMLVDEGMDVEAGQVLARLDDSDARARLTSAAGGARRWRGRRSPTSRCNLANAERELGRGSATSRRTASRRCRRSTGAHRRRTSLQARIALARAAGAAAEAEVAVAAPGRRELHGRARPSPASRCPRTPRWARWCRRSRPAAASPAPASRPSST